MPRRKKAVLDPDAAKIRDAVVADLKPHITELFESLRTEIQDLRNDVPAPEVGPSEIAPEPAPRGPQPQAAPQQIDMASVGAMLKGTGLGDDQIGKLTSMFQSMQAANAGQQQNAPSQPNQGAPVGAAGAPQIPGAMQPMQMMMLAELIKALAPLIQTQNPMAAELMMRSMYDTAAFNAAMHRKVMMQHLGASNEQIAQAAGMPYLQASHGLMTPVMMGAAANMPVQPGQVPGAMPRQDNLPSSGFTAQATQSQAAQSQPPVGGAQK